MPLSIQQELALLRANYGIHYAGMAIDGRLDAEYRARIALDSQPGMITTNNAGIPFFLANLIDPEVIRVLVTPMQAEAIAGGGMKKGDWTTMTEQFKVTESTGQMATYGDYSTAGQAKTNTNWVTRESYHAQTITQWGEREISMYGLAQIDAVSEINIASALTIEKFLNKSFFYGISSLQNYGLLNDPSLPSAITPVIKAATGTSWSVATGDEVFADIQKLFAQLVSQARGYVNRKTQLVLALSPESEAYFTKTNQYGINISDLIKKNFPNMRVETAVEYDTDSGELVQMFAENLEGIRTVVPGFTERMRAHPVIAGLSSWQQKKSAGTWGTVIRRPFAVAQMLGV